MGAAAPRAAATGGAWVHAPPQKRPATGEIRNGFLLFAFASAVRSNVTCKATKSQQQCFSFPFLSPVPSLLSFPDLSPASLV